MASDPDIVDRLAQIVVDRRCGDGALAHRNGDLIEPFGDVSYGIYPIDAGPLLGVDDNAPAL